MITRTGNGTLSHKSGTLRYTLHKKANETLEKGGIQAAVMCPEDVDPNEWIAVHAIDFYNDITLIFGVVQEECTNYSCPIMSAGENYEFLWTDKYKYRKPTRLPARLYIDYLMNWIVRLLEDDDLFPVQPNVPFPRDYLDKVQNIFRRMFRVYSHIFYSHLTLIQHLDLMNQFKFSLTHFLYFVNQFYLVSITDIRPLREYSTQLAPSLRLVIELNALYKEKENETQIQTPESINHLHHLSQLRDSSDSGNMSQYSGLITQTDNQSYLTPDSRFVHCDNNHGKSLIAVHSHLVTSEEASSHYIDSNIFNQSNPVQYDQSLSPHSRISSHNSHMTVCTSGSYPASSEYVYTESRMIDGEKRIDGMSVASHLFECEMAAGVLPDGREGKQPLDERSDDDENKCDCTVL